MLLVGSNHVVLHLLGHDARGGDVGAVRLLVGGAPRAEKAGLVLQERLWNLGVGNLCARTNSVARVGVHLDGTAGRIVGQVQLVAKAGGELHELLRRHEIERARNILSKETRLGFDQKLGLHRAGGRAYRNDGVEDANEAIGSAARSFPAHLGTKIVAHADTGFDTGMIHDAHKVIDKLRPAGQLVPRSTEVPPSAYSQCT